MNVNEKRIVVDEFCTETSCDFCPLRNKHCEMITDNDVDEAYTTLIKFIESNRKGE